MSATVQDPGLKARHRAMWASGDYPRVVQTFVTPLGPRLVEACGISEGKRVRGDSGRARFEQEHLIVAGTRR